MTNNEFSTRRRALTLSYGRPKAPARSSPSGEYQKRRRPDPCSCAHPSQTKPGRRLALKLSVIRISIRLQSLIFRCLHNLPLIHRRISNANKTSPDTAPLLPRLELHLDDESGGNDDHHSDPNNDMNGTAWTYEEAARSKEANPPPAPRTMPSYTQPRNVSGPLAVETNGMTPHACTWKSQSASADHVQQGEGRLDGHTKAR